MGTAEAKFSATHMRALARTINQSQRLDLATRTYIACRIADLLAASNERFDRTRFLDACGVLDKAS